jgi:hypothetical protein
MSLVSAQILFSVATFIHTAVLDLFFYVAYRIPSLVPELSECSGVLFVGMFNSDVYSLSHSAISFVTDDVTE